MSIQTLRFTWRSISSLKNPSAPPTPPSPPSETWSIFDRLRKKTCCWLAGDFAWQKFKGLVSTHPVGDYVKDLA